MSNGVFKTLDISVTLFLVSLPPLLAPSFSSLPPHPLLHSGLSMLNHPGTSLSLFILLSVPHPVVDLDLRSLGDSASLPLFYVSHFHCEWCRPLLCLRGLSPLQISKWWIAAAQILLTGPLSKLSCPPGSLFFVFDLQSTFAAIILYIIIFLLWICSVHMTSIACPSVLG